MESKFYEVTVEIIVGQTSTGRDKKQKERYLVDAMTVTEAEARVVEDFAKSSTQLDYKVVGAKESRIERVIEA